jgi:hypothetical protein
MTKIRELLRRLLNSPKLTILTVAIVALASWGAGTLVASMQHQREAKVVAPNPTAEVSPSQSPSPSPTQTPTSTPKTPTSTPKTPTPKTPTPTPKTAAPAQVSRSCTKPVFVTSGKNGGWSTKGYYVHNNMWNDNEALGPETLYACAYNNWYVVSNQTNRAGAVKTYPNVHKDYNDKPISSFSQIKSTFAASSPHVGIYNVAYDIWLNGVADNNSTEIMIWTENYKQVPAGNKVTSVNLGGRTYNVWKKSDNKYIAFVPTAPMTSGSVDLLQMFKWLQSKGWVSGGATVGQICYGVEIVSTNGAPATFSFTDFSITSN